MKIKSMRKGIVFSKHNSVLLLLLLVFCSCCGVSFGMDIPIENESENNNKEEISKIMKEQIYENNTQEIAPNLAHNVFSIYNEVKFILGKGKHGNPYGKIDKVTNFINKCLYLFGCFDFHSGGEHIDAVFLDSKWKLSNKIIGLFQYPCYNFLPMKRYDIFNGYNKIYLGITDMSLKGILGSILGAIIGRVALELDLSLFCKNDFVKDRFTCTILGVRPLVLVLSILQNWTSCGLALYDSFLTVGKDPALGYLNKDITWPYRYSEIEVSMPILNCFQILAVEFKFAKYFYVQVCVGNFIFNLVKNRSNRKKTITDDENLNYEKLKTFERRNSFHNDKESNEENENEENEYD